MDGWKRICEKLIRTKLDTLMAYVYLLLPRLDLCQASPILVLAAAQSVEPVSLMKERSSCVFSTRKVEL